MGQTIYRKDYKPLDYTVTHVDLEFDIRDGETFVTSTLAVKRNGDHARPFRMDGEQLELLDIELNGAALAPEGYTLDDESLSLQPPADDAFTVKTRVRIDPGGNKEYEGLYKSGGGWFTQCESQGFRRITYMLDRPDNMATYNVRVLAAKGAAPVLLSNGNPVGQGETPDGRHYTEWHDPFPKPSYLFALVASKLDFIEDKFTTKSGRDVTLRLYAEAKDIDKLAFGMQALKRSMKWDEDVYGREYDLDLFNVVAVDDFNAGAMENKSLNIFNTRYLLAHPFTQTDTDFDGVDSVLAHEYFHNWTGDRITCRDWFQLTLKEGLTVFRDQEYSADMGSRAICRIEDVRALRAAQFPEDAGPLAHPIRPDSYQEMNNFYTATVYNKGAEVIRMVHTLLGAAAYRQATDLYFDRHDGQAVTCEDFVKCMEDASGRDLSQFRLWYSQAGTPTIDASWTHDADGKFTLTLKQTVPPTPGQPMKQPMHFPVSFGLVGADGKDLIGSQLLELTEVEQSFTFDNIPAGAVPSILRNFSAPVKLNAPYTDAQLKHLMVHDSDAFNQWDAGQKFIRAKMLEQIARVEAGFAPLVTPEVVDVYRNLLARKGMDKAFKALMLARPGFQELSQHCAKVNPDAVQTVQKAFAGGIASSLEDALKKEVTRNKPAAPYAFTQDQAASRALKNTALAQLAALNSETHARAAYRQFKAADNMTDRIAALGVLLNGQCAKGIRDKAVHDFYEMYKDEPLAINKWFTARVAADSGNALDTAKLLAKHPAFNAENPNRVRALYGAFSATPRAFHAVDGSGYAFMADFILDADTRNSQLSSRLVDCFAPYERYADPWKSQMQATLMRMAQKPGLSKGLSEKLEKFGAVAKAKPAYRNPAPEA